MSHIVQIQTQVKDAAAVRAACKRLGLAEPVAGKTRLFSGEVQGLARIIHEDYGPRAHRPRSWVRGG